MTGRLVDRQGRSGGQLPGDSAYSESRSSGPKVVPVSALNRAVGQVLSRSFPMVWVSGEMSNLTVAASGHAYFTLKDQHAQVRAVMFRSRLQSCEVTPRNGQQVLALASVSLYEARGEFQLSVENLRLAGQGDWHQRFARLKEKLQAEGLFDIGQKRPIPAMPARIGVITSLQAAALRDVLTTLARRSPHVPVIIYPTPVQGSDAPGSLVQAFRQAVRRAECDLLLLVRGGGSIEDLWAFNDEKLARAIRACPIPVVVGVGHESDVTIADFAADLRAPTPTGAADLAGLGLSECLARFHAASTQLLQSWRRRARQIEQRIDTAQRLLPTPQRQWQVQSERLSAATRMLGTQFQTLSRQRMARLREAQLGLKVPDPTVQRLRLTALQGRLQRAVTSGVEQRLRRLDHAGAQLNLVSPRAVLARGYAVVRDRDGNIHTSVKSIKPSDNLNILINDGEVDAHVDDVRPNRE